MGRRTIIRNQITGNLANVSTAELKQQVFAQHKKISRKNRSMPKTSAIAVYAGVFALVVSFVAVGYRAPERVSGAASLAQTQSTPVTIDQPSIDQLVATNIAADLAESTNLPVAANVANLSVSLAAKSELAQTTDTVISKPQIVQPNSSSREVTEYVAKAGDTASSVASQYGISPDTLKWANNLTSDALEVNRRVVIPPVDGVIYTVKDGDTVDSIASKYRVDKARLIAFNDLELSGLTKDKRLVLPGGVLPENERPGYSAPRTMLTYGSSTSYTTVNTQMASASAGNRYAFGNCTWYAYERRAQLGRPVGSFWGNAATWASYAQAAGYVVNNTPAPGAVMQNGGGYGHVAIVESVGTDGSVTLSEMNYAGNFNKVTSRTISGASAAGFNFIH